MPDTPKPIVAFTSTMTALEFKIEQALTGFFRRNPQHAWSQVLPGSIRELRAKYSVKP